MKYAEIEWNKGVPRSTRFGDVYFSADGGIEETRYVFLHQNALPQRWQQANRFVIAETGFGTGLNFLVTLQGWLQAAPAGARLHYISIEKYPVAPDDIERVAGQWPALRPCVDELLQYYPPPVPGMHLLELAAGRVRLHLVFDDVESALEQIGCKADAWYLDGFAPARNPGMWHQRVFELIGRNTSIGGSFATYTAAGEVRRGLARAGFVVRKQPGYGSKRDMLNGFMFERHCYSVERPWFTLPVNDVEPGQAVVVGAGLAGLTAARALIERGWAVTLIDRHASVAAEASGNPAGLLMPRLARAATPDMRFYLNAFLYAIRCLERLQADAPRRFWFNCGNLLVDDEARLKQIAAANDFTDSPVRYIDVDEIPEIAGVDLGRGALLLAGAGWVDVRRLCTELQRACGDRLDYLQASVVDLQRVEGGWRLCADNGEVVASSTCVVLANGSQAKQLPGLDWLPLQAARGQLTYAEHTDISRGIRCGISAGRYITPAHEGRHIIGASYQLLDAAGMRGAFDDAASITGEAPAAMGLSAVDQRENIGGINRVIPECIAPSATLDGRAACRAVSNDRVPIIGCVPDRAGFERQYHDLCHGRPSRMYPPGEYLPGLYLSTGHGSRGLCSCFIAAEMIASMVCNEPAPVEKCMLDYVNPARFLIRRLKRGYR